MHINISNKYPNFQWANISLIWFNDMSHTIYIYWESSFFKPCRFYHITCFFYVFSFFCRTHDVVRSTKSYFSLNFQIFLSLSKGTVKFFLEFCCMHAPRKSWLYKQLYDTYTQHMHYWLTDVIHLRIL